jgi:hypothetical protein
MGSEQVRAAAPGKRTAGTTASRVWVNFSLGLVVFGVVAQVAFLALLVYALSRLI